MANKSIEKSDSAARAVWTVGGIIIMLLLFLTCGIGSIGVATLISISNSKNATALKMKINDAKEVGIKAWDAADSRNHQLALKRINSLWNELSAPNVTATRIDEIKTEFEKLAK